MLLRGKQQKDRGLTLDEFEQLRSLVDKISWIAKESRPMGSGTASILAQRLKALTVSDVLIADRRQDRRAAVDLAIVRETLKTEGSRIRWIPHPLRMERRAEALTSHWEAGLGRRENPTECRPWQVQGSQSSETCSQ